MKKRDQSMQIRPSIVGWVVVACLASVACLPQTSGILGITEDTMQVGISLDSAKNLQNLLVATAPGKRVSSCITVPSTGSNQQQCKALQVVGTVEGVQVSAVTNQADLAAIVQSSQANIHNIVVQNAAGSDTKRFLVKVTGDTDNIRAANVVLPSSATQALPNAPVPNAPAATNPQGNQTAPGTQIPGTQPQNLNAQINPQIQGALPVNPANGYIQDQSGFSNGMYNGIPLPTLAPGETLGGIEGVPYPGN